MMKIHIKHQNHNYEADLNQPMDISIPLGKVRCFYAPDVEMTPYQNGDFVGSVKAGAPVNFFNVKLNPHGNGTHTECIGHITLAQESVNVALKKYHFIAQLISVEVEMDDVGDKFILKEELENKLGLQSPEALVIRTIPNTVDKLTADYSDTNPPFLSVEAMKLIYDRNIKHLLIDLPSVDKEYDEGKLKSHHVFWNAGMGDPRNECTITELIYVNDKLKDGLYLLNLQMAALELDASPSRPVLYNLKKIEQ